MAQSLVRFEGAQELIIERLTKSGIYKTRSEILRAGVLELAKKYKVFENLQELEDELAVRKMDKISREMKAGKRRVYSEKEVKKKYGFK